MPYPSISRRNEGGSISAPRKAARNERSRRGSIPISSARLSSVIRKLGVPQYSAIGRSRNVCTCTSVLPTPPGTTVNRDEELVQAKPCWHEMVGVRVEGEVALLQAEATQ